MGISNKQTKTLSGQPPLSEGGQTGRRYETNLRSSWSSAHQPLPRKPPTPPTIDPSICFTSQYLLLVHTLTIVICLSLSLYACTWDFFSNQPRRFESPPNNNKTKKKNHEDEDEDEDDDINNNAISFFATGKRPPPATKTKRKEKRTQ